MQPDLRAQHHYQKEFCAIPLTWLICFMRVCFGIKWLNKTERSFGKFVKFRS